MDELRRACAAVAARARFVTIAPAGIPAYAAGLPLPGGSRGASGSPLLTDAEREPRAAAILTLDAINFGSGWFPTLRKDPGRSGYGTIAAALARRTERHGSWSAAELLRLTAAELATVLGQDPGHELMALYARSLGQLGAAVASRYGGSFAAVVAEAEASAERLARELGGWPCFADRSRYDELELPFLKRAQIAAADLDRAGVVSFADLGRLTMFADNLVPHVLRLDGILRFAAGLSDRIGRGELIAHDSREEIEIRACAVHAVELIVAARPGARAADVDTVLWERGGGPAYKAVPRHRTRCTAY